MQIQLLQGETFEPHSISINYGDTISVRVSVQSESLANDCIHYWKN
jgi:hypothetical protein